MIEEEDVSSTKEDTLLRIFQIRSPGDRHLYKFFLKIAFVDSIGAIQSDWVLKNGCCDFVDSPIVDWPSRFYGMAL
jgi:hypothetical protein